MKEIILPHVLSNAIKYQGKANANAVLGHVLALSPELKQNVPAVKKMIASLIEEVSVLSRDEQVRQLAQIAPQLLEERKPEKKTELKELPRATVGKFVTRFAPSPSGPLHIGHAYLLLLNAEYAKKYSGKLILRIEDTNPSNIDPAAYHMLEEDAVWLTQNSISSLVIQSDRLPLYYAHAENLVQEGKAYICTCDPDKWKELMLQKTSCPCRCLLDNEHIQRYHGLFTDYAAGEAVLRLKTDIAHKNPAMRDFALMRINEDEHPRTKKKYRVWPLMNFAVAIDDHDLGITHTIRAKDHMDNEKKQALVFNALGWQKIEHLYVGRINFEDLDISKTKTKALIQQGVFSGWDDIRLPFFRSLKRRGYQPEAFVRFAREVGLTQNDKTVSKDEFYKNINAFNKDIIDKTSSRFFFIEEPKEVTIQNAPSQTVTVELHPNHPEKGKRTFVTHTDFYLSAGDYDMIHADVLYRLMDCLNFEKRGGKFFFHSRDYETYKKKGEKIMHWLPKAETLIPVEVVMPDKTTRIGLGESALQKLSLGEIVQFERFGFCKLNDRKKDKMIFWFCHK